MAVAAAIASCRWSSSIVVALTSSTAARTSRLVSEDGNRRTANNEKTTKVASPVDTINNTNCRARIDRQLAAESGDVRTRSRCFEHDSALTVQMLHRVSLSTSTTHAIWMACDTAHLAIDHREVESCNGEGESETVNIVARMRCSIAGDETRHVNNQARDRLRATPNDEQTAATLRLANASNSDSVQTLSSNCHLDSQ